MYNVSAPLFSIEKCKYSSYFRCCGWAVSTMKLKAVTDVEEEQSHTAWHQPSPVSAEQSLDLFARIYVFLSVFRFFVSFCSYERVGAWWQMHNDSNSLDEFSWKTSYESVQYIIVTQYPVNVTSWLHCFLFIFIFWMLLQIFCSLSFTHSRLYQLRHSIPCNGVTNFSKSIVWNWLAATKGCYCTHRQTNLVIDLQIASSNQS